MRGKRRVEPVSRKLGNARLLRLARLLRTKKVQRRFDFRFWVGGNWKGAWDLSCGTTACALGWATTDPYFRRLGLRLTRDFEVTRLGVAGVDWDELDTNVELLFPATSLFGITVLEASDLFVPGYKLPAGASALQVAEHIEAFVAARKGSSRGRCA